MRMKSARKKMGIPSMRILKTAAEARLCSVLLSALCTTLSLGTTIAAQPAQARSVTYNLDIPTQSLNDALQAFALASQHKLLYSSDLVNGKISPALKGQFTTEQAVKALLFGSHLNYEVTSDGLVLIRASDPPPTTNSAPLTQSAPGDESIRLAQATSATASAGTSTSTENQSVPTKEKRESNSSDEGKSDLTEIVVTGTNITGVDNKTVPLISFDRDAIDRTGFATMQDFITALPQNSKSGANSPDGVLSGVGFGFGNVENSTAANLRGLGANSTLTLINGHRVAPSSDGTGVDLSMIPLSAVERIDILTDGSSAVYGSDAVGGVVNIILRKDFNGEETSARLDTLARGGGEQKQVGQTVGRTWGTGSVLVVAQFEDANNIRSDQRSFTTSLPVPTDIYPSSKRYSGVLTAHQALGDSIDVFLDTELGRDTGLHNVTLPGGVPQAEILSNTTNSVTANSGLTWRLFGDWHLEGNALFSQVYTAASEIFLPEFPGYTNGTPYLHNLETIKEGDLKLDGTLWTSGGSSLKAAVGASYRQEAFSQDAVYADDNQVTSRHVHAVFAELYAPLITAASDIPFVKRLELSAAIRDDNYSDFGSKLDPKFGIYWAPTDQLGLRASYSSSFRAPDANEFFDTVSASFVYVESGYPQPGDPTGNANVIFFGNQKIGPETSHNLSAGLDFKPTALPNTTFSLNYYRLIYSNRIVEIAPIQNAFLNPQIYGPLIQQFPNDAATAAFVAGLNPPQQLVDLSNSQTGLAGVRYGFPYGAINAAKVKTEGLDLNAHSVLALDARNKLNLDFNATYNREIATTYCDTCVADDLANTVGQPLRFRLRTGAGWSNGSLSANAALNFANRYSDIDVTPAARVGSFTTIDCNAAWHIRTSGTTVSLNLINALNSNPPRTPPGPFNNAYDPNNADARGRILSLQVRQSW
jgi:iron complex outermembrane recepter protein